ncbi:hypothetical protein SAMN04487987_103161 [Algibacter pectinivorans]|uniref:Uncharacterized protein n=2 Tax=Algibacter pectinivorans TaxID=870482 RepID=A0A1I1P4D7_9FLAO|nr:hypothetical protein SAMN04487987_103161 [Algibacter pectinivorans]
MLCAVVSLSLMGCSSDSDGDSGNAKGSITLSGEETSVVGTSLTVGNILEGAYQTGTTKSVTLTHKSIDIEDGEINPTTASLVNSFIIVTAQFDDEDNAAATKAISMIIIKNGEEYRFVCASDYNGGSDELDCGSGFNVDQENNQVTFDDTTVENTETGKVLTLNGVVTW